MLSLFFPCVRILFLLLLPFSAGAQSVYLSAAGGYAWSPGTGPDLVLDGYPYTGSGLNTPGYFTYERPNSSLAAGAFGSLAAGMAVSHNLAMEVTLQQGFQNRRYDADAYILAGAPLRAHIIHYTKNPLFLTPSVLWQRREHEAKPFLRLGIVLPLRREIITETFSVRDTVRFYDKREIGTTFSAGFNASAGYSLPLTRYIAVTATASFTLLSLRVKEALLVASTANSIDLLPSRSLSQTKVEYVEGFYLQPQKPDMPGILPSYRIPFHQFGLQAGMTLNLGE